MYPTLVPAGGGVAPIHAIPFPLVTITTPPVQYKGDDLDPERGPGLGCFRFQLIILGIFIVLTPLTVAWQWPEAISAALLFAVVILLLITGQTIIFLLRLVAADRRRPAPAARERDEDRRRARGRVDAAVPRRRERGGRDPAGHPAIGRSRPRRTAPVGEGPVRQ